MRDRKTEDGRVDAVAATAIIGVALVAVVFWLSGLPS